ncbi:hypothetical protein GCM10020331_083800 [Ectobacillus funiculus]
METEVNLGTIFHGYYSEIGKGQGSCRKNIRVMIVDDDPMVMEVNKQFVEATGGFEIVGAAQSGIEALAMIAAKQPHLVILDHFFA